MDTLCNDFIPYLIAVCLREKEENFVNDFRYEGRSEIFKSHPEGRAKAEKFNCGNLLYIDL